MSKSLGNGIDPLEVIDKYGADALRLTLMTGNAPGNDMRFLLGAGRDEPEFRQQGLERFPLSS
jgi:valyl-tRNA synthetase